MRQHLFPQGLQSRFSQQNSYHSGSRPGTLEVRQIHLAEAFLNDTCVMVSLPISFLGPTPLAPLPPGRCASFPSAPLSRTMASILRYSWPMVWPMLPGPWNRCSSEALITQTSCADFKHTHQPQDRLSWRENNTKYTSPVLKPASSLLINPPCCSGWKKHLRDYFCPCGMENSPNPQKCSRDSLYTASSVSSR